MAKRSAGHNINLVYLRSGGKPADPFDPAIHRSAGPGVRLWGTARAGSCSRKRSASAGYEFRRPPTPSDELRRVMPLLGPCRSTTLTIQATRRLKLTPSSGR